MSMRQVFYLLGGIILMLNPLAMAQGPSSQDVFNSLPNLENEHEFDGIEISKYSRFWENWRQVTVRFRKDNNEQRFVYANDIAYRAMKTGVKTYPNGAMFGKVAFSVKDDQAFPNSLEPHSFTRIQLMKKDSTKYLKSNGWGYALYAAGKGVDYANAKATVQSCHACHELVAGRDYVFSRMAFSHNTDFHSDASFSNKFRDKHLDELDEKLKSALEATRAMLPEESLVRVLEMSLFDGSVNESIGPIIQSSRKDQLPYLLADKKSGYFISAVPILASSDCRDQVKLARIKSVHPRNNAQASHRVIVRGTACGDDVNWEHSGHKRRQ